MTARRVNVIFASSGIKGQQPALQYIYYRFHIAPISYLNMNEFDPEDLGLDPTWRIGSYNRAKDSVDRMIPAEANFFIMSYLDRNLPNLPPFKMYTIDQGVAERCYTTDYTRLSIDAYKIPNKNAFENVMERCKDPRWYGALGEWEEDHKMSHFC